MSEPDWSLTSPPDKDLRHMQFRQAIVDFFRWRWHRSPPWGVAESAQLARVLRENPELDEPTFKRWLFNYSKSQDYPPGEAPRSFLPRISNYSVSIIDKMRKDIYAKTITVKDEGVLRSRAAAIAARREEERHRLMAGETQKLLSGKSSLDD